MRKALVSLCFIALAVALPASAQMAPKSMAKIYVIKTKPSMSAQWEAGMKKLIDWSKQQNRPTTYYCWSIITGPRTGQYALGTFGHDWKDFDAINGHNPEAGKIIGEDMDPYTESVRTSYWTYRLDLSGHPGNAGQAPPAFSSVTTFYLKVGGEPQVEGAIKEAGEAAQRAHWQGEPSSWYSLVNGGYGGQLALVTGHENWADFQPPAKTFFDMLSDVLGKEGFAALGKRFNGGVRAVRTEIWAYRPDLSYIAASQ